MSGGGAGGAGLGCEARGAGSWLLEELGRLAMASRFAVVGLEDLGRRCGSLNRYHIWGPAGGYWLGGRLGEGVANEADAVRVAAPGERRDRNSEPPRAAMVLRSSGYVGPRTAVGESQSGPPQLAAPSPTRSSARYGSASQGGDKGTVAKRLKVEERSESKKR